MKSPEPFSDALEVVRAAARLIRSARYLTAFTGAGISVESGIPPFRGAGGLWSRYDPRMLELDYFLAHPDTAWPVIKEIFYDHFGMARPNKAHEVLAAWDHRHLNLEAPEFAAAKLIPTTENIAISAWNRLEPVVTAAEGARLSRIRVYETPEIFAEYRGEA